MCEILVGGVETFSTVDFPGKLAAVVFMQGCPWRCPFCYNAIIQKIGQQTNFLWPKFIEFLNTRIGKLDAVVFSGGEPLVQDCLSDAIIEVRNLGFEIGLHTGGYRPDHLQKVLPLVDWVGLDIKAPLDETRYQQITKTNHLKQVCQSLDLLLSGGKDFECRTTCDPRYLSVDDICQIGDTLSRLGVQKYFLQKYRPVRSDTQTTDSDCENLISSAQIIQNLKSKFVEFDIRK